MQTSPSDSVLPAAELVSQVEHTSLGVFGERGTGKSLYAMTQAVEILRKGGRCLTNMDVHPLALSNVLFNPYFLEYDNSVVRLPDAPNKYSLSPKLLGYGWFYRTPRLQDYSLVILDECSWYLNARTWADMERMDFLSQLVHARKFGYREMFLAHSPTQIDAQVRQSYLSTVKILLRRPPQFWRRVFYNLGISRHPIVCTVSRDSDGDFPTDLAKKEVWARGLIKSEYYTLHNPVIWSLYKTRQIFDFKVFNEHTSPFLQDGVEIFGISVRNAFVSYRYVEPKFERGVLKRLQKTFAYYRPGAYAVISPRLLSDCFYVQSKLHTQFLEYQKNYNLQSCSAPSFKFLPVANSVNPVASQDSRFYLIGSVVFIVVILLFTFFLSTTGYDVIKSFFFTETPVQTQVKPIESKLVESKPKFEPKPESKPIADDRFKNPSTDPIARYPVCRFFNILEQDMVTIQNGKNLIDRDWLLQLFKSYPFRITNFFIDPGTGMPRYTLLFNSAHQSNQVIESTNELELFNYGWRSAMTGYHDSHLVIYSSLIWIFVPVNSIGMVGNSYSAGSAYKSNDSGSNIFSLPNLPGH
jgi:Zonular occludens toxin (Zot)